MSLFKRNKNFAPAEPLIWKKTWNEMNEKLETLKTRNNYLVRQNMKLAEAKDAEINAKDAEINAKDAEIKAKDAEINAKDAEIKAKTNQLGEKHQKMRAEIDQLRQAVHAMATSEKMRTAYLAKIAKEEEEKMEEKMEEKKAIEKRKKRQDLYMDGAPAGIPYQFHYKKTRNPMPLHK